MKSQLYRHLHSSTIIFFFLFNMKTATWYQSKVNYVFLYESSKEMDNNSPLFGKKKVAQLIGEKNFQSWK